MAPSDEANWNDLEASSGDTQLDAVLKATGALLVNMELSELSMEAISIQAGISQDVVLSLFPNKRAVILAFVDRVGEGVRRASALAMGVADTPELVVGQALAVYLDSHRIDPMRMRLRFIIRSDAELSRLDLEGGRKNAAVLTDYLMQVGVSGTRDEVLDRVLLVLELSDAAVRMISHVEDEEAIRIIDGYSMMAVNWIFQTS